MTATAGDLGRIFRSLAAEVPPAAPVKSAGSAGIVTAAGGLPLLVNAWLLCTRLRELGCSLPIEVVHAATEVIPDRVRRAFPPTVAFRQLDGAPPGFSIKAAALWTSPFDRCLWVDADNLPLTDPACLVREARHARFWPDAFRTSSAEILDALARPRPALEFESGQMVIPTLGCARALWIARQLNERWRDPIYAHVAGDKDTFRLAWALAGERADVGSRLPLVIGDRRMHVDLRPLPMIIQLRVPGAGLRDVGLVQYGPDDRPLFLHRTAREWRLHDDRERVSWAQSLDEQVETPRERWKPDAPMPTPAVVADALEWGRERLGEIEWFPKAIGVSLPERLWLKHRFTLEAAVAGAAGGR